MKVRTHARSAVAFTSSSSSVFLQSSSLVSSLRASYSTEGSKPPVAIKGENLGGGKWRFQFNPHATYKLEKEALESSSVTTKEELLHYYEQMSRIRRMETEADKLYKTKEIKGFLHLYSGQEAVCIGLDKAGTKEDQVITAYRDHGHAICRGSDAKGVLAELLGKATGVSKGKGGSMHMYSASGHFYGGNGIVGAQVPVGAGLAFSQKYLGTGAVAWIYYGDGAANQGQVFEAFNMSALWKLPAIYVIENNKYGMGTSAERASANIKYYTRGDYIPGLRVDGMDVLAVKEAGAFARAWAKTQGPILLEMETYRYSGHSMSDPGVTYRTREEIQNMRATRDPIERVKLRLLENEIASAEELKAIDNKLKEELDEAVKFARESAFPASEDLWRDVYDVDTDIRGVELAISHHAKH